MSQLRIEMFPAKSGDCFLISCIGEQSHHILIDLGYSETYRKHVEARLKELDMLDLFIVTHIDRDHIRGGVTFLKENGDASNPKIIPIKEVWHNSYRHLPFQRSEEPLEIPNRLKIRDKIDPYAFTEEDESQGEKDISFREGSWFGALLLKYGYSWNQTFGGKAVTASPEPILLGNGEVRLTLLTPTPKQLQTLQEEWEDGLFDYFPTLNLTDDTEFDDVVEYLTEVMKEKTTPVKGKDISSALTLTDLADTDTTEDDGAVNGSSISFLLEFAGKTVLFLGDATPKDLEQEICNRYKHEGLPLSVDVIKIAHHGSARNTTKSLMEVIDANAFLISANGKHGHPQPEALARIVNRSLRHQPRMLCFNHATDGSNQLNRTDWKAEHSYSIHTPAKGKHLVLILSSDSEEIEVKEV